MSSRNNSKDVRIAIEKDHLVVWIQDPFSAERTGKIHLSKLAKALAPYLGKDTNQKE